MSVLMTVLHLILTLIQVGLIVLAVIFVFQVFQVVFTYEPNKNLSLRRNLYWMAFRLFLRRYVFPIELLKWVVADTVRGKVYNKLFGIWCFTGYFGQGKTLGAVTYALKVRAEYAEMGIHVHIFTNFNMHEQDGKITCWQDLIDLPKYTIVIFDEIQSTFTSQKFKDFPIELLWKLTQCRKNQLCVFASSPVYSRMAIQLRENTDLVVTCENILKLDRWFRYGFYRAPEYEKFVDTLTGLFRHRLYSKTFLVTDYDYQAYDTEEIVDRLDIEPETATGAVRRGMSVNERAKLRDEILKEAERLFERKTA